MHEEGQVKVCYDLTFIKGDAPYFANLSEILFRPKSEIGYSIDFLRITFPAAELLHITLSGGIRDMLQDAQRTLRFPADKSYSIDAFSDFLCDLSWLESGHLVVVVEMTDMAERLDQCMIIDAFAWAVLRLNLERRIRLSVLVVLS